MEIQEMSVDEIKERLNELWSEMPDDDFARNFKSWDEINELENELKKIIGDK